MKQEERKERSRNLIIQAGIEEFGNNGFNAMRMEILSTKHGISKGLLYHYFRNKDEIYLECVRRIVSSLFSYLEDNEALLFKESPSEGIAAFCMLRERFFQNKKAESRLYEEAVIDPPEHLKQDISEIRTPLRNLNERFVRSMVSRIKLQSGITADMAARYLDSSLASFRMLLSDYQQTDDFNSVMNGVGELLKMLIFGIADK